MEKLAKIGITAILGAALVAGYFGVYKPRNYVDIGFSGQASATPIGKPSV